MNIANVSLAPILQPASLFTANIRRTKQRVIQHQVDMREHVAAQNAQIKAKIRASQVHNIWPPPYKGAHLDVFG